MMMSNHQRAKIINLCHIDIISIVNKTLSLLSLFIFIGQFLHFSWYFGACFYYIRSVFPVMAAYKINNGDTQLLRIPVVYAVVAVIAYFTIIFCPFIM